MDQGTRDQLLFDLTYALRHKAPLEPRGRRRQHADDMAFQIAARRVLEHLELCGWHLGRKSEPGPTHRSPDSYGGPTT